MKMTKKPNPKMALKTKQDRKYKLVPKPSTPYKKSRYTA